MYEYRLSMARLSYPGAPGLLCYPFVSIAILHAHILVYTNLG
jgi:hypothetical protein